MLATLWHEHTHSWLLKARTQAESVLERLRGAICRDRGGVPREPEPPAPELPPVPQLPTHHPPHTHTEQLSAAEGPDPRGGGGLSSGA